MTDATSTTEDEFYDDATTTFPSKEDLAPDGSFDRGKMGNGRLVAIWAVKNGTGKKDGKPYDYVDSINLVLDDGPEGNYFSEMVPAAPFEFKMQHSTGGMVARLKGRVDGKNAKGVQLRFRPMIGRVNTQPSKANSTVAAYSIRPCTDDEREIVERYKAQIIDINNRLEAEDAEKADAAAFE